MSVDERITQLEQAFATLARMVEREQERTDLLAGLVASEKKRTDTLVQLVRDHDERSENHTNWLNELGHAQAETEKKIAALVDAQIRSEDTVARLAGRVDALTEQVAETNATVAVLAAKIDTLVERMDVQGQGSE